MSNSPVPLLTLNDNNLIPQLGLGVWQASDDEAEKAVSAALANGYRLIDTAAMYQNETGVGRAIAASGIDRKDIFVTTKLWNTDQGYENALAACETSLKRLGVEYIDLYLIHWPTPEQDKYIETWRALGDLRLSGKVRSIGVSNFMPEHLTRILTETETIPAINQIEIHPDFQQRDVRKFCADHNIMIEAWSPIGGTGGSLLTEPNLVELSKKHSKTPAQIALRWHIQSGHVVIPKSVHEDRIKENIDVFDFELTDQDMAQLDEMDGDNRIGPHPIHMNHY